MGDQLILVDLYDKEIGSGEKLWVHQNSRLHRAFSVFLIKGNQMLIQQRAWDKYHSGGLWANACCSHPRVGESLAQAVPRRMMEELGMKAPVRELFSFVYREQYDGLSEYEFDHVFLSEYDGEFIPDPDEIAEIKWISFTELEKQLLQEPECFAAWFLIAAPRVLAYVKNRK